MPFIERQDRTEREEVKFKIRPEVLALVRDYARFLESEEWYVVQEALRKSLEADKDFLRWRKQQTAMEPGKTETQTPAIERTKAVA